MPVPRKDSNIKETLQHAGKGNHANKSKDLMNGDLFPTPSDDLVRAMRDKALVRALRKEFGPIVREALLEQQHMLEDFLSQWAEHLMFTDLRGAASPQEGDAQSAAIPLMPNIGKPELMTQYAISHQDSGPPVTAKKSMRDSVDQFHGHEFSIDKDSRSKSKVIRSITAAANMIQEPETWLARALQEKEVTQVTALLILTNTAFIGFETDYTMKAALSEDVGIPDALRWIGLSFTVMFTVELILRIYGLRAYFFVAPDWKWNIFDAVLVITALFQEILSTSSFTFVRTVRIFRMLRITRIFRVIKVFNKLRQMILAISQSLMSLIWAFLLLLLIMYICAIFFMQGAATWLEENGTDNANAKEIKQYYGSIGGSLLSLIGAISGGDWQGMAACLAQQSEFHRLVLIGYIVFVVFGVLNVLTGVFVADAAEIKDRDLVVHSENEAKSDFMEEMKALFEDFDHDKTGTITLEEFIACMRDKKIQAHLSAHDVNPGDAFLLFELLDQDGTSSISLQDFITGAYKLKGGSTRLQVRKVRSEIAHLKELVSSLIVRAQGAQHVGQSA